MSKSLNGRLIELQRIHQKGSVILTYANTGFIPPNYWLSGALMNEFLENGLLERHGKRAKLTKKGIAKLQERSGV